VSARVGARVGSLHSLWPGRHRFICNGIELQENATFEFYGIQDGDSIIVLPDNAQSLFRVQEWISVTRDQDEFNNTMQSLMNRKIAGEFARLRDLHLMRSDARPQNRTITVGGAKEAANQRQTLICVAGPPEPSESPLPICW
jgi:hypothetical protein